MKKLTIAQLIAILKTFIGTTIINIHAVTPHNGFFRTGFNGSRKKADKMITLLGIDPKNIMKEQSKRFFLTDTDWGTLNDNALNKNVLIELANWDAIEPARQAELLEMFSAVEVVKPSENASKADIKQAIGNYEVGARKNGTTINSYLAETPNGKPMITAYALGNKSTYHYFNKADGKKIDLNDEKIKPFINPNYGKTSNKQLNFGHTETSAPITNNFRLDRILDITLNGTTYEVVSD